MSRKHKNVCTALDYLERSFILVSATAGCVSISVFTSLVAIHIGIASSTVGTKMFAKNAGIRNDESIIKKKKKKYDKIVLIAKTKN